MPNSLKSKLKSLKHKGKITQEEYKDLIHKLDGHDAERFERAYNRGYEKGFVDGSKEFAKGLLGGCDETDN